MAIRHQRDYQKPEIREQQTIQWPQDTKGIIRSSKSKDRQYNGQQKKNKRTSNDLQDITQKTKDRAK